MTEPAAKSAGGPAAGLRWAVVAVAAIALLAASRPFGPVGLMVALAVALAVGLLAVSVPMPSRIAATARPPAPSPVSVEERWRRSAAHHDEVLSAYGSFELDPAMLLRYPGLWDLSAPAIIAFHDSLATAGELRTDSFPGNAAGERYIAAVTDLRSTWAAADRFARSTGTDDLDPADARDCRRALKLLAHADGARSQERAAYLQQVLTTVDRLTERGVVPQTERVRAGLTAQLRRAIEA